MRGRLTLAAGIAAAVLAQAGPAGATPTIVYSNIPSALPADLPSWSFEQEGTQQLGGQVQLAPGARTDPIVTVRMSSWACQKGTWLGYERWIGCETEPGTTFPEQITLNLYEVGPNNSVGKIHVENTQTFNIPYRPSASSKCTEVNSSNEPETGRWYDAAESKCLDGLATDIHFNFDGWGLTLPEKVIVTVAYKPYNGLNLNLGLVEGPPLVGSDPLPEASYLESSNVTTCISKDFSPSGTGGVLKLIPTGWTGCQPAMQIEGS